MRLTTEGKLYLCLGHDDQVDLKRALREGGLPALDDAIDLGWRASLRGIDFQIATGASPAVARHMSVTGG